MSETWPEHALIHQVRDLLERQIEQGEVEHVMEICEFMLDMATTLAERVLRLQGDLQGDLQRRAQWEI